MSGREVFVVGGANSAGQAALHLATYARRVTVLVRATSLDVGMSAYLVRQVEAAANIDIRLQTEVIGGGGDGVLEHLVLRDAGRRVEEDVPADGLFVMIGAQPHTEWLPATVRRDEHGFVLTDRSLERDALGTELLETLVHGVDHPDVPLLVHGDVGRIVEASERRRRGRVHLPAAGRHIRGTAPGRCRRCAGDLAARH